MIIRLVTPISQLRITTEPTSTLKDTVESKVGCTSFTASLTQLSSESTGGGDLDISKTLSSLGIKHGSYVYVYNLVMPETSKPISAPKESEMVIPRSKSVYCNHASNAMCSNCAPLDPWDPSYYSENKIKYLSFRSYLAMLKKNNIDLEDINYLNQHEATKNEKSIVDNKIGNTSFPCQERHGPQTACALCIPQSISLQPQIYRMVDHIEFESKEVVTRIVNFHSYTGKQRFGYLIGKECEYDHVPFGSKVVVSAIYEPLQENFPDGFTLFQTHKKNKNEVLDIIGEKEKVSVESYKALYHILEKMDLDVVGMIYTNINQYGNPISSLETNFIAKHQLDNLHYCKENKKYFNSKFVTVIVHNEIPDEQSNEKFEEKKSNIVTTELMVSHQAMSLTHTNAVLPTEDPEWMMINKNVNTEIFYRGNNKYGIAEKIKADPYAPVEYFWVRLTHGYKKLIDEDDKKSIETKISVISKKSTFVNSTNETNSSKLFNWNDSIKKMNIYFDKKYNLEKFANLDILIKIKIDKMLDNFKNNSDDVNEEKCFDCLIKAIRNNDNGLFESQFKNSQGFNNFKNTIEKFNSPEWNCEVCTFINNGNSAYCEMCGSPNIIG